MSNSEGLGSRPASAAELERTLAAIEAEIERLERAADRLEAQLGGRAARAPGS